MRLLLDSHALLWWLAADDRLSDDALGLIDDATNEVMISLASVWELGIKRARGKVEIPDLYLEIVDEEGISVLDIVRADVDAAVELPPHHRDPFDRMLIAQAVVRGCTIVTVDRKFAAYGVATVSAH